MALPASGPISGSQIWEEVNGSTTDPPPPLSLGGMIASSSLSNTDPDKYSEFYGYDGSTVTSFYRTTVGTLQKPACNQTSNIIAYHDGASFLPVVGDKVYTNSAGTTALANGTYGSTTTSGGQVGEAITINGGSGNVSQVNGCKG